MKWKTAVIRCLVVAAFGIVGPIPVGAQAASQNAAGRTLFTEGRNFWDEGKFTDAERKFREALTKYPRAEQSDRTAYYLITTLMRLGRTTEARTEIESFYRNYPQSSWRSDVDEKRLTLDGLPAPIIARAAGEPGFHFGEPIFLGNRGENAELAVNAQFARLSLGSPSLEQEILRLIIEKDADHGIETARKRLKTNSSDPAVIANLGAIARSTSARAVPFLVTLAGNSASSPNVRSQAIFWLARQNSDKAAVAKALVEMVKEKDTEAVAAEVLGRFNNVERRATLEQIVQIQHVDRVSTLDRLFRSSTNAQVRSQVVQAAGSIAEPSARTFLTDIVRNEKDLVVRRTAIQALAARKDVDVKVLQEILNALQTR